MTLFGFGLLDGENIGVLGGDEFLEVVFLEDGAEAIDVPGIKLVGGFWWLLGLHFSDVPPGLDRDA